MFMKCPVLLADPSAKIKSAGFSTMLSAHTKLMGHAITDDRSRYIAWDGRKGGVHLYDHETDPQELNNLADDPAQKGRVAQLKVQIEKHLQQVGGQ